jgi:DeoR/GlpR family transcriptional regulator of sugar metabolism
VISGVDQVDVLITDRDADVRAIKAIRARGVEVKLV